MQIYIHISGTGGGIRKRQSLIQYLRDIANITILEKTEG
ncbi:hypothetical protein FTV88_0662 [Heliorestis convoluta]|uniref:Uncharacterized protein n=2 Tax=Heliorestis convoluta TaxID=356322 RepID=A0A5Q2N3D3_9FIRM|nr:hypothetical protein FTV88_0662 [Heliorestis convoluta]